MPVGRCVMRTADFGLVDVLPAGAAGAHRIDADVVRLDVDIDVLGFRQHRDRRRRRMNAPAALPSPARAARDARRIRISAARTRPSPVIDAMISL